MATGKTIDVSIWSEPWFIPLSDSERNLVFYLACPEGNDRLSGLTHQGPMSIAERMNRTQSEIQNLIERLVERRVIIYDEINRLAQFSWVCDWPSRVASNPNNLKRWWSEWRDLPESPLKYAHLVPLTKLANLSQENRKGERSMLMQWAPTFGLVLHRYAREQLGTDQPVGWFAESDLGHDLWFKTARTLPPSGSGSGSRSILRSGSVLDGSGNRLPNRSGSGDTTQQKDFQNKQLDNVCELPAPGQSDPGNGGPTGIANYAANDSGNTNRPASEQTGGRNGGSNGNGNGAHGGNGGNGSGTVDARTGPGPGTTLSGGKTGRRARRVGSVKDPTGLLTWPSEKSR